MLIGGFTRELDVAQVVLYVFWGFWVCLVFYLRREDHREGYPLVTEPHGGVGRAGIGFPIPPAKILRDYHGGASYSPPGDVPRGPEGAVPAATFPGAPLVPTGNPLIDGVGPASYCYRKDVPDLTIDGQEKFKPLRVALEYRVDPHMPRPQGMRVISADGLDVGGVIDVWIDEIGHEIVFLEVELAGVTTQPRILIPQMYVRYRGRAREVVVRALAAEHFLNVPRTRNPDMITRLEEDKIVGYFGGGTLYGRPGRSEPFL